jgi:hypothetical protein
MDNIIDQLLRNGAREIDIETIKKVGNPQEVKETYEHRGWTVIEESESFIFDKKDSRVLLKG